MMTSEELTAILEELGWTCSYLAKQIDRDDAMVRRWTYGGRRPPPWVEEWLRRRLALHRSAPAPVVPRQRGVYDREAAEDARYERRHAAGRS